MAINSGNEVNENSDKNKKDNTNYKQNLINDYVIEKSQSNEHVFLDSVFDADDISDIKSDLEKFKQEKPVNIILESNWNKWDRYPWVELNNSLLNDLKKKISPEYMTLKNKRDSVTDLVLKDYDLSNSDISKLLNEVNSFEATKLSTYIKSEKLRIKFLKSILWNDINNNRKDIFSSIIPFENFNEKLKNIDKNDRQALITTFTEIKGWIITDSWLKTLIKSDFLNEVQKIEIVKNLIPNITLDKALSLGYLTESEVKGKKDDLFKDIFDNIEWISDIEKENIINKTNNKNLFIITEDLITKDNVLSFSEEIWFSDIENENIKYIEEVKKQQEIDWTNDLEWFKKSLKDLNIAWYENIKVGSIFKFTIKLKESYSEEYLRLDKYNKWDKSLDFSLIWKKDVEEWKTTINKSSTEKVNEKCIDYITLLENKEDWKKVNLEVLVEKAFEELIKDTEKFNIDVDKLDLLETSDFENDIKLQKSTVNELNEIYDNQIGELEEELAELLILKKSLKSSDDKELKNVKNKINKLELRLKAKKDYKDQLNDDYDLGNIDSLAQHNSFNELLTQMDTLDPDWKKLWLEKWLVLETKDWAFEIIDIDFINQTIEIKNCEWIENNNISYEDFFKAFKFNRAKRIEKINNFDEILINNKWDKDYKIENDNFIQKDVKFNWKKEDKQIDYLINGKWKLMYIDTISGWFIDIKEGKYEEWKANIDDWSQNNKIELSSSVTRLTLTEFNKLITYWKFKPDWRVWKDYSIDSVTSNENNIKRDFVTAYMNRLSIMEVFAAWKMTVEWIEDYLKRWNEVKSAELAMKISRLIPWDFSEDFVAQTELKQSEAMEKELTALWKIASWDAFKRIIKWILNKNTPEYKKEAWLMLAAKYWMMYPKNLAKYDWTFLWYEAMWGQIWDLRYEKYKLQAEKSWLPFDEKELIIDLLWAQCLWYAKPARRSKFYKDFKWKIAWGFWEEYDTWYQDAQDKRAIWDINAWWLAEVITWVVPNALWWAQKAVEKWWTLKEMNTIYFSLLHSWWLYNAPWKVLEKLKQHWLNDWNGMIVAAFASTLEWQKIFNETVKNVSIDIEEAYPDQYSWLWKTAIELYNNSENSSGDFNKRAGDSIAFWDKYWDVLSRTLFMADWKTEDSTDYLKTDKIIALWSEWKYKNYFDHIKGWTTQATTFNKGLMEDEVWKSWITWLDTNEVIKKHYSLTSVWTFRSDNTTVIDFTWGTIWWDIKSVEERYKQEKDPAKKELHKKYLNKKLREVAAWLITQVWERYHTALNVLDPVWLDMRSIWITLSDLWNYRESEILDDKWSEIFDKAVENIINWRTVEVSSIWRSTLFSKVQEAVKETKDDAEEII